MPTQSPHVDLRERGQVAVVAAVLLLLFIPIAGGCGCLSIAGHARRPTRAAAALSGARRGEISTIYTSGRPGSIRAVAGAQQT
jgi:hypothetical protein